MQKYSVIALLIGLFFLNVGCQQNGNFQTFKEDGETYIKPNVKNLVKFYEMPVEEWRTYLETIQFSLIKKEPNYFTYQKGNTPEKLQTITRDEEQQILSIFWFNDEDDFTIKPFVQDFLTENEAVWQTGNQHFFKFEDKEKVYYIAYSNQAEEYENKPNSAYGADIIIEEVSIMNAATFEMLQQAEERELN